MVYYFGLHTWASCQNNLNWPLCLFIPVLVRQTFLHITFDVKGSLLGSKTCGGKSKNTSIYVCPVRRGQVYVQWLLPN